jgi:hypothetical protein
VGNPGGDYWDWTEHEERTSVRDVLRACLHAFTFAQWAALVGATVAIVILVSNMADDSPSSAPRTASDTSLRTAEVRRADLGSDWPLTVESGVLRCADIEVAGDPSARSVTFTTTDGTTYAVNATAQEHTDLPPIDPLWADDPAYVEDDALRGLKITIWPLVARGLELCGAE